MEDTENRRPGKTEPRIAHYNAVWLYPNNHVTSEQKNYYGDKLIFAAKHFNEMRALESRQFRPDQEIIIKQAAARWFMFGLIGAFGLLMILMAVHEFVPALSGAQPLQICMRFYFVVLGFYLLERFLQHRWRKEMKELQEHLKFEWRSALEL